MDTFYKQWQAALEDFQKSAEKDLEEIRRHKAEMQQMKLEVLEQMNRGRYLRDENRVVISAPEIVIGNVDKSGTLKDGVSTVIVRATNIAVEGVGDAQGQGGSIVNRAASIRNIAVDPGIDGVEQVVGERSEFVAQARNVVLQSDDVLGCFPQSAFGFSESGVRIHADRQIAIEATLPGSRRGELLEAQLTELKSMKDRVKTASDAQKSRIDDLMDKMEKLLDSDKGLNDTNELVRTNYLDISALNQQIEHLSSIFSYTMEECLKTLSLLAETNRQITCLEEQQKKITEKKDTYQEESTGASVSIHAERMDVVSMDGDGNLRTNPGAGVGIVAKEVSVRALNADESLMEESAIRMQAQHIVLSTADQKVERDSSTGELTTAEYPAVGDVRIVSKDIALEALDNELKDGETVEKALTEQGSISLRAETLKASATDTEGKAAGSISLNAKAVEVKAMDVDKEKRTDTDLAEGSTLLLLAEKMYAGSRDEKVKSQSVQIVSDKVGLFADTTAELQQGDGKAVVQLDGGNVATAGEKNELYGETTVNGAVTLKAEAKAGNITVDHLEVKSSFKTPCTSEGVAVPAASASGKLSAKLKAESASGSGQ